MLLEDLGLPPGGRASKFPVVHVILPFGCTWQCLDYPDRRASEVCREHLTYCAPQCILSGNFEDHIPERATAWVCYVFPTFPTGLYSGPMPFWVCVSPEMSRRPNSSILGSVEIPMRQDQGWTCFSLMPERNPRQGGLHTDLDQTSIFWRLVAAAEGYLPAFQRSLYSHRTLTLHYQDTAARWCGLGTLLTHAFSSCVETYFRNSLKPSVLSWAEMVRFHAWRGWQTPRVASVFTTA